MESPQRPGRRSSRLEIRSDRRNPIRATFADLHPFHRAPSPSCSECRSRSISRFPRQRWKNSSPVLRLRYPPRLVRAHPSMASPISSPIWCGDRWTGYDHRTSRTDQCFLPRNWRFDVARVGDLQTSELAIPDVGGPDVMMAARSSNHTPETRIRSISRYASTAAW